MSTQRTERIPQLTLGWRLKMSLGDGSAQDMADYLGVSRQTVSRWMADKGAPPKRAYLAQWSLRTGVDLAWLESGKVPVDGGEGPDDDGGEALRRLTEQKARRARGRPGESTGRYTPVAGAA